MNFFHFHLQQIIRQMWFLPAMFCLVALATIAAAHYSAFLLPQELPFKISEDAIENILTILATSMLTVATFALATMVSAFFGAAQGTSPRAVRLIAEDRAAQAPISIFIGAFLFSVVGIIALSSGFYSASGRLILFGASVLVVILVVGALIRWINKISSIGQVGETIRRIEMATSQAFREIAQKPLHGCLATSPAARHGHPVHASEIGYVQHLRVPELQEIAEKRGLTIHIAARPGAYATPVKPLVQVAGSLDDSVRQGIQDAFVLGPERTFNHDPRFGLIVLNEIAARALSPGVNDPGTAISVIHTDVRILEDWIRREAKTCCEPKYDRVSMVPVSPEDILDDAFRPVARDGAANVEVCVKLLQALEVLQAASPDRFGAPVRRFADMLLDRVRAAMSHPDDLAVVERAAHRLEAQLETRTP